jgi:terminase large subunit-like protein
MSDKLTIAPKQLEGLELLRKKKFTLFSGPRYSLKTVCNLIGVCEHAWRTPGADIAAITVSQSAGLESGVWDQLVDGILPKFMDLGTEYFGGAPMQWIKKPYTSTVSKKPACIVSNAYGGKSRIQLESLKDEREVEKRFKAKNYTMIYVPELSNFKNRKTFDIWAESLRAFHLKDDQFLFAADTNPDDEGDESWIYQLWFITRVQEYDEYCTSQAEHGLPVLPERAFKVLKDSLGLLEFEIADNIFASQQRVDELVARYSHDQDLHDRYIRGLWVKASKGALFAEQFRENIHVAGELETPGNPDPLMLIPQDSTWTLYTSIDPGSSANSAGYIFDKVKTYGPNGKPMAPMFIILDEVAIIGEDHSLEDFTIQMCERVFWWEQRCGRIFKWIDWSDRSVFEQRDQSSKKYYHQLIFEYSARFWEQKYRETQIEAYRTRRISLMGADRGAGTLPLRVDLAKRLLFENRILISKTRCPHLIRMYKSMPPKKEGQNVPPTGHKLKHAFDGHMYGIAEESFDEIASAVMRTVKLGRLQNASGLVSVQ